MELTPEDKLWIEWARNLPTWLQEMHDREQAVSISAFKAGLKVERQRARKELLALARDHGGTQVSINRLRFWIDAVCPADGEES